MNLKRRVRITWLVLRIIQISTCWRWLIVPLVTVVVNLVFAFNKKKTQYMIESLRKAAGDLKARSDAFLEWRAISATAWTTELRQQCLARASTLQAERKDLQRTILELQPRVDGNVAVMQYVLTAMQGRMLARQRKYQALSRIVSQIESSPTFYWDLLVWFITSVNTQNRPYMIT